MLLFSCLKDNAGGLAGQLLIAGFIVGMIAGYIAGATNFAAID